MTRTKRCFKSSLAMLSTLVIVAGLVGIINFPVSAAMNANASPTSQSTRPIQYTAEDSTFELVHSNVQISDDYLPESVYISEIDASEYYNSADSDNTSMFYSESEIPGDPMVYYTQKWLNQQYGNVPGFGSVIENGRTGWDVVYGLTRALQHELGITDLANSFGPTTSTLYGQNLLYRQDGVTDRRFAILQGALWCKGYNAGYNNISMDDNTGIVSFSEVFDASVEAAVIYLKEEAGFINPNGVVTLNVMKALMSMDSFRLLGAYGGKPEIRAMQQKLNRKYEAYAGLTPCDGVYGRNTNRALIYAFQAEEGLPVGVATGSFGPTTRSLCPKIPYVADANAAKSYQGLYYTSAQISAFTELLQFALYLNGFDCGNIDGVFGPVTQQALVNFQQHYVLPRTGKADISTWMSLFLSSGDPNRSAIAADCATILTAAKAKTLFDNGYRYIGRYLTGTYGGGISKALTIGEANIIFEAGLRFFPIYQTSANYEEYFTEARGISDAQAAIAAATALGLPKDTIIYFAVDFDAMDYQITDTVIPYFKKVHEIISASIYKTGIYGARNVCSRVAEAGYSCSSFVGDMSTGFSGNLGFKIPNDWAFSQFANLEGTNALGTGDGRIEIDKNAFSGRNQCVSYLDEVENIPALDTINAGNFEFGIEGNDTLTGPTIDILGVQIPLFKLEVGVSTPSGFMVESEYNAQEEELEVIIGLDVLNYSEETYGSREKPTGEKYQKAFKEVKSLVSSIGKTNEHEFTQKFNNLKGSLSDKGLQIGFDSSVYIMGYMTLSFKTGQPVLTTGEMGLIGKVGKSWKYPITPWVYVKFDIEGSFEAGFKLVRKQTGQINLAGHLKIEVQPSLSAGLDILVASAYAGISGKIECALKFGPDQKSFKDSFEAELSASVFFEYNALLWGDRWDYTFARKQLYPISASENSLLISPDNLKFIEPLSQTLSPFNVSVNPNIFKENMQVYCKPQIINLGNGKMFMTYVDDSASRTNENRSILMYSVYNGTSWGTPQIVSNDGTADFEPSIYPDGNGGAHIVWQNANTTFSSTVTLEEMSAGTDLCYIHWNGNSFENSSALTSANQNFEAQHKIVSSGNNISVIWVQNSENDPLALSGTNSIFRKQFTGGAWQNIETLALGLPIISSIDTTYIGSGNVVAYTTKTNSDLTTINDLEVFYFNGVQTVRLTNDNVPDYSVKFLNDELFWISDNSIVSTANGDSTAITKVVENSNTNVSEFIVVGNSNGNKSIVWEQEGDSGVNFYGVNYNTASGSFGTVEPLSTANGVIRGWDACMLSSGQIEIAYCFAEKFEEPVNGKPYGRLDLMQNSVNKFFDISVNPIAIYKGELVAGQETVLLTDIYNNGSLPVSQFDVKIFGTNNILEARHY